MAIYFLRIDGLGFAFIVHLLENSPDYRGMITSCDTTPPWNCACVNVIRRYLKKQSLKREFANTNVDRDINVSIG